MSKVEGRPGDAEAGRQDLRSPGGCVVIRTRDCRRSGGDQRDGSGPPAGTGTLRLHLAMIPPGTRGTPHLHPGHGTAGYVVSGEAEVWHGTGLIRRSVVRAGDFIYIPPGTPHLAVNRGDVTSIAVLARHGGEGTAREETDRPDFVTVELPSHLAALLSYPVGYGE